MTTQEEALKEIEWKKGLVGLVGKRVEVEYTKSNDWVNSAGVKRGWLREYEGHLVLQAKSNSQRFIRLTGGMFDGFHATVTVKNIKAVA